MKKSSNEQGSTMIETILYICVLLVLGVILAGYMHKAIVRYRIGRVTQQVHELKKAIVAYTASDEDYSKLTMANMAGDKALPTDMQTSNNSAHHALQGAVDVGVAGNDEDSKYMFYIEFDGIPRNACIEIVTQGQFFNGSEMDTLVVNNTHSWRYENSLYKTIPATNRHTLSVNAAGHSSITINDALTACSQKNNNKIKWIFS